MNFNARVGESCMGSSLAYPMITHTPVVAGNLPLKTLVANKYIVTSTCGSICVVILWSRLIFVD